MVKSKMQDYSLLEFLPDEHIPYIMLTLPFSDIINVCQTNIRFNRLVCQNEYFWKQKYIYDYQHYPIITPISWRDLYIKSASAVTMGQNTKCLLDSKKCSSFLNFMPNFKIKKAAIGYSYIIIIDLDNNVIGYGSNEWTKANYGNGMRFGFKAKDVSATDHTLIIDLDNNLWVSGRNDSGQLGLGHLEDVEYPIKTNIKCKTATAGYEHSIITDLNGNILTFGSNKYGQLGLGDTIDRHVPTLVNMSVKIRKIVASDHTIFIDDNNEMWVFGNNEYGQLSLGDKQNRLQPVKVANILVKDIAVGYHTILLDFNNDVWIIGGKDPSELGLDDNVEIPTDFVLIPNIKARAVYAVDNHSMIIDLNGTVWAFGSNDCNCFGKGPNFYDLYTKPEQIGYKLLRARDIAIGSSHTIILLEDYDPSLNLLTVNIGMVDFETISDYLQRRYVHKFDFRPEFQTIPHNPDNIIASFSAYDGTIYLVELLYDANTNKIYPPI